jgi:Pyruvate/2-oxoacid:ferredoxin oxidoreductase delta subunit
MKVEIKITKEVEVKIIAVNAEVRYWEDAKVDGIEDKEGDLIPCRNDEYWCPEIDIDSGIILNWEHGKNASLYYKVCDGCGFDIKDINGEIVYSREDGYVPSILCPKEAGYGDYIIMDVSSDGKIQEWNKYEIKSIFQEND